MSSLHVPSQIRFPAASDARDSTRAFERYFFGNERREAHTGAGPLVSAATDATQPPPTITPARPSQQRRHDHHRHAENHTGAAATSAALRDEYAFYDSRMNVAYGDVSHKLTNGNTAAVVGGVPKIVVVGSSRTGTDAVFDGEPGFVHVQPGQDGRNWRDERRSARDHEAAHDDGESRAFDRPSAQSVDAARHQDKHDGDDDRSALAQTTLDDTGAGHRASLIAWKRRRAVVKVLYESSLLIHTEGMQTPAFLDEAVRTVMAQVAGQLADIGPVHHRVDVEQSARGGAPSIETGGMPLSSPPLDEALTSGGEEVPVAANRVGDQSTLLAVVLSLHDRERECAATLEQLEQQLHSIEFSSSSSGGGNASTSSVRPTHDDNSGDPYVRATLLLNAVHRVTVDIDDVDRRLRQIARDGAKYDAEDWGASVSASAVGATLLPGWKWSGRTHRDTTTARASINAEMRDVDPRLRAAFIAAAAQWRAHGRLVDEVHVQCRVLQQRVHLLQALVVKKIEAG